MTKVVRIKCKLVAKLPFSLFIVTSIQYYTYNEGLQKLINAFTFAILKLELISHNIIRSHI